MLEELLPEQAPDDAVFRLALAATGEMKLGRVWLPVVYFALWISRLMGWMPALGHCAACGVDLRGGVVWWSATVDGVLCVDDRRRDSAVLSAASIAEAQRIFRTPIEELAKEEWPRGRVADLRSFAIALLERHLDRRIRSARVLERS